MVPQTSQDIYFNKLASGVLKTAVTSCADETVEKDVQTEDLGQEDKAQQAPEDQLIDDYKPNQAVKRTGGQRFTRASTKDQALKLDKFMSKACPVMEQVVEENEELRRKTKAPPQHSVETKANLQFPAEILMMLGTREMTAQV